MCMIYASWTWWDGPLLPTHIDDHILTFAQRTKIMMDLIVDIPGSPRSPELVDFASCHFHFHYFRFLSTFITFNYHLSSFLMPIHETPWILIHPQWTGLRVEPQAFRGRAGSASPAGSPWRFAGHETILQLPGGNIQMICIDNGDSWSIGEKSFMFIMDI